MKEAPSSPAPDPTDPRQRLTDLSKALMNLHKTLIESERVGYEASFGKIETPGEFLQLLMGDPWFAWLRPVSELMAAVDEAVDAKEPVTPEEAEAFFHRAHTLLTPSEIGEGFGRHYFDALQRDPDVLLGHAVLSKMWKSHPAPPADPA